MAPASTLDEVRMFVLAGPTKEQVAPADVRRCRAGLRAGTATPSLPDFPAQPHYTPLSAKDFFSQIKELRDS